MLKKAVTTALVSFLMACFRGPGIGEQQRTSDTLSVEGQTSDEGVTTGIISSNAGVAQTLSAADQSISGASVTFAPGSLSIDMNVSLEQGSDVAGAAASLGVSSTGVASNALVISGSEGVDAVQPFTLQLPLLGAGLTLAGESGHLVVFYRVKKHGEAGQVYNGVVPTTSITVVDGKATFETRYFGSYQAAYVQEELTEAKEEKTDSPILTKKEEKKLSAIDWNSVTIADTEEALSFSADVTGLDPKWCIFQADRDKLEPIDYVCKDLATYEYSRDLSKDDDERCKDSTDEKTDENSRRLFYARFICEDSSGRLTTSPWSEAFEPPGDGPIGDAQIVENSLGVASGTGHIDLDWTVEDPSKTDGFYFVYLEGDSHPQNCNTNKYDYKDVHYHDSSGEGGHYHALILGFKPGTKYSFRLCAKVKGEQEYYEGRVGSFTTQAAQDASGNSICPDDFYAGDETCTINADVIIPDGTIFSGSGNLHIGYSGGIQSAGATQIDILVGGELKIASSDNTFNHVSVGRDLTIESSAMLSAQHIDVGGELTISGTLQNISASDEPIRMQVGGDLTISGTLQNISASDEPILIQVGGNLEIESDGRINSNLAAEALNVTVAGSITAYSNATNTHIASQDTNGAIEPELPAQPMHWDEIWYHLAGPYDVPDELTVSAGVIVLIAEQTMTIGRTISASGTEAGGWVYLKAKNIVNSITEGTVGNVEAKGGASGPGGYVRIEYESDDLPSVSVAGYPNGVKYCQESGNTDNKCPPN